MILGLTNFKLNIKVYAQQLKFIQNKQLSSFKNLYWKIS